MYNNLKEAHIPFYIPVLFKNARDLQYQIAWVLAKLQNATADEVTQKLEELNGRRLGKTLIADIHLLLADLYDKEMIRGKENNGELTYALNKVS